MIVDSLRAISKKIKHDYIVGTLIEKEVLDKVVEMFSAMEDENFIILSNIHFSKDWEDTRASTEEDIIIMHPVFGIKLLQVKSKRIPYHLNDDLNQLKHGEITLYRFLQEKLSGKLNNEKKLRMYIFTYLVYPRMKKSVVLNAMPENGKSLVKNPHYIFKEDIEDLNELGRKLLINPNIKNKKDFEDVLKIMEVLLNYAREFGIEITGKKDSKIVPVITRKQIRFFDKNQLKIVRDYKKGTKIIRGLAGTGKTFIAENLIEKLSQNPQTNILVLTFNTKLSKEVYVNRFKLQERKDNVKVLTFFSLSKKLGFLKKNYRFRNFKKAIKFLSEIDPYRWAKQLEKFKAEYGIDYFIIDEAQDIPKNFLKAVKDVFENLIILVDESQATNEHSVNNINIDVFGQSKLGAKVSNLYTIYRSPSRIMELALKVLLLDDTLPYYFKSIGYVKKDAKIHKELSSMCILDGGFVKLIDNIDLLKGKKDFVVFVKMKEDAKVLKRIFGKDLPVYTYESIKGLEFENVLLYEFDEYIETLMRNNDDKIFRKLYVVISRATNSLFIHWKNQENQRRLLGFYEIFLEYCDKEADELQDLKEKKEEELRYLQKVKTYVSNLLSNASKVGHTLEGLESLLRIITTIS